MSRRTSTPAPQLLHEPLQTTSRATTSTEPGESEQLQTQNQEPKTVDKVTTALAQHFPVAGRLSYKALNRATSQMDR
ncbi:unnamed protein product [Acanthoscelides obtectus]|uniref:Uncharacterized protein n=1 Tax=Acanthoscelides obtectus TaxID=200917 RepID=A0A9P0LU88_ACAOB|nr:unnamed protein product [Acanthoscelides obtectus]CAK1656286.1 hypothetical protein AOBTE_LOCUS19643 [Acanthoscelides obtectus]